MSDLDTILSVMTAGFQQVNERLDRLEERVGKLEEKVGKLDEKVGMLDEKVGMLEERVRKLDEKVGKLETRTESLEAEMRDGFADTRARFDALQQSVERIERQQQEEVIGMLRLVKGKTEIHEYKIDSLNKRLLEAEANIQKVVNQ